MEKKMAVLVTTAHRGVFFGYLASEIAKEKMTLTGARNVVRWSSSVRGFMGLAALGPVGDCRIGPKVSEITIWDITSVTRVTDEAAVLFEEGPWRG